MPNTEITAAHLEELANKTHSITLDISKAEDRDLLKLYMKTCKSDGDNKSLNEFLEDMFTKYQELEKEFGDIDIDKYAADLQEKIGLINDESTNLAELENQVDKLLEYKEYKDFSKDYPSLFAQYQDFIKNNDKTMIVAELTSSNQNYSLGFDPLDKNEDNSIKIRYGNFSGSKIHDINLRNIEDVNFRDCNFERIKFHAGYLQNNDFRGATIEETSFVGFSKEQTVIKLNKFSFAKSSAGNQFGFMRVYDEDRIKLLNKMSMVRIDGIKEDHIRRVNATNSRNQSMINRFFKGASSKKVRQYTEDEKKLLEQIEVTYNKNILAAQEKNRADSVISMHDSILDPTYIPGQDNSKSKIEIYFVKQADFDNFLSRETNHSLNEFITTILTKDTKIIADLSKLDLKNRDLSNLNLSGVNFAYCDLSGVNFSNCNLQGACFEGAIFDEKTIFHKANLTDSNLVGVKGDKVDFSESILTRSRFLGASLLEANFNKAQMYLMNATLMNASHSNFQEVDAQKAKFKESILLNIDARNAKMQMANLEKAIIEYADFSGADMTKAVLLEAKAQRTLFIDSILTEVQAELANFTEATMTKVKAENSIFTDAILNEVQAEYANFKKSLLKKTQAKLANFKYANLEEVIATESDFSEAIIERANLKRANLNKASLKRVKAAHANMLGSTLREAQANEGDFSNTVLNEVDATLAHFNKGIFNGASAEQLNLESAIFSNVTAIDINLNDVRSNEQTILLGSKINGINTPEEFIGRYNEQYLQKTGFFAPSKYGSCLKINGKGESKRFELQKLGAKIVGSATGATTGMLVGTIGSGGYLESVLMGITGGVLSSITISAVQQYSYKEQGYIDNFAGDRLAEIGAVCKIFGISTIDSTKNLMLLYSGLQILNLIPNPYISIVSNFISENTSTEYGLGIVAMIATKNATQAFLEMKNYSMADAKIVGLTPEDAVELHMKKIDNIKEKYSPTKNKLIVASTVLATSAAIGTAIVGLTSVTLVSAVALSALSYVYDKQITNGVSSINNGISSTYSRAATKMISSSTSMKKRVGQDLETVKEKATQSPRKFVDKVRSSGSKAKSTFVETVKNIFSSASRKR